MEATKLKVIKDYDKLSDEIKEQLKLVYPKGYRKHLIKFTDHKGAKVSALRFETFEKIYMIRMTVEAAKQIIEDDSDYDDDGNLKDVAKEKYEDEHADIDYLSENENYDEE